MPRRKAAQNCKILPWLSEKQDNSEGRFLQIGNSLLLSDKFGDLSASAQHLYLCAAMEAGGHREFIFPAAAMKKYHLARSTAQSALNELTQHGFIELMSCGKITREPNQYRFSFRWKGLK